MHQKIKCFTLTLIVVVVTRCLSMSPTHCETGKKMELFVARFKIRASPQNYVSITENARRHPTICEDTPYKPFCEFLSLYGAVNLEGDSSLCFRMP